MNSKHFTISILLAALSVGCASVNTTPLVSAPEKLKAPAEQNFAFDLSATGVQIYSCKPSKADSNKFEWTFVAPEAELFNRDTTKAGKHYAGPSWEALDGSKVVAEVTGRADSPEANAIPWLLLTSKATTGVGIFSNVKSIQRVATVEGKAPASGCDAGTAGKELRVPYQARYNFFVAK
ncbi:MAG: DUF3455 domain-containing protein [Undibacterium sp.]|nr:DUF3455 domain-containing protein [Undibacterium sp.]